MTPLLLLFLQAGSYPEGVKAYAERRFADAIPLLEKAAAGGSQALAAQYMLGNALLQAHQADKAAAAFAALFEVRPDSAAAHLLTAEMMLRFEMVDDARREARRALELDAHIPQGHYILGEAGQSLEEMRAEIRINPNFSAGYYRLGEILLREKAWDDAIAALQRAIWLNPNHNGPYLSIGKAYLAQGDAADAAAAARHALDMNPRDPAALQLMEQARAAPAGRPKEPADPGFLRGRTEYVAGHIAAAVPLLEKARAAGVDNNELFFMLGNIYLQSHQIPKARAAFGELFAVAPESGAARLFTAQMLMRAELEDEAQVELEAAVAHEPNLPQAHYMLGELAIYRAQIDKAASELSREIALNPDFALAYYRLGDAYTHREDWEHAVPPLQRAIWLNPTYSGPYILLGKAYFKMGDLTEAERLLRRALQMDPRNASAHYLLGRTLIQAGHADEGKRLLKEWEELREKPGAAAN
ncbi:MAG: tetratricopeptide repeat protein [Bryobacteraceae bacterium]|jgi:tetratricopeptide (TPR) repeat protein